MSYPTTALNAAHNDKNHYQDAALSSFSTWHRIAWNEARARDGNLTRALIYSAYSLHFLEDFFAPGHIRTPRAKLHDAAAMNIHDRFNEKGQWFLVNYLDQLTPFLAPNESTSLKQAGKLYLLGDGKLGCPRDNPLQATFLAAVVARALADVFEAYLAGHCASSDASYSGNAENHFNMDAWEPYEPAPSSFILGKKTISPVACIHYGCYERVTDSFPLGWPTVLALEGGAEALLSTDTVNRAQGELSLGPITLVSTSTKWRSGTGATVFLSQVFAGLEWNHVFARGFVADGVRFRVYFPITEVDFQATASATYRWYRGNFGVEEHFSWDGGFQFGFGLVFVGIAVGQQHVLNEANGQLALAWTLTSSVTFMVSPSIVRKIGNDRAVAFRPLPSE